MINLANNQSAMLDSLFTPVNGKTYDGYIEKVTKNKIDFWARGKHYTINKHGVICRRSWPLKEQGDNRTFYQCQIDNLCGGYMAERDFANAMLEKYGITRTY